MTDATRQIIDFAQNDDGVEFRNALYSAIHDKVTAHIDAKKQEIAHTLLSPQEDVEDEVSETEVNQQQETEVENT